MTGRPIGEPDPFGPRVNPFPQVFVNGALMATTALEAAGLPGVVAAVPTVLDDLQTTWGRQRLLDHHDSQQGRFSVIDARGALTGQDLIGSPVTFAWVDPTSGTSRTFFRGRIAEHRMRPRPNYPSTFRVGRWRGTFHDFTCTGQLTELGNRTTGVETWPEESFGTRMNRLRAIAAPVVAQVGTRAYWDGAPVSARNVDNQDVLSLIKSMYDSAGADRMTYDPHTNTITFQQRRVVIAPRRFGLGINTVVAGDPGVNVFQLANAGEGTLTLDGAEFDGGSGELSKAIESRLTRVDYSWNTSTGAGNAVLLDSVAEAAKGRRGMNLATEFRQGDWAGIAASDWYELLVKEGSAFAPPVLTFRGDLVGGFRSLPHAQLLISGVESTPGVSGRMVGITNTPWPRLNVPPAFGIIGGTIRYSDGAWTPSIVFQPCDYQQLVQPADLTGVRMRLTGGVNFQWRQLSHSLTWNDLKYAGTNGGF